MRKNVSEVDIDFSYTSQWHARLIIFRVLSNVQFCPPIYNTRSLLLSYAVFFLEFLLIQIQFQVIFPWKKKKLFFNFSKILYKNFIQADPTTYFNLFYLLPQ